MKQGSGDETERIQKSDRKRVIKLEKLNELAFYTIRVAEVSRNNDADGFGDSSFQSNYFQREYCWMLLLHQLFILVVMAAIFLWFATEMLQNIYNLHASDAGDCYLF